MPKTTIPIETLISDLHGTDWQKRCDAARLLGQSRDPRAVDALLPDLQDEDWRVRRNAVQALGASKSPRALEPLIAALKDRVATVRERAAVGLGRIKDPRAIQPLVDALMEEDKKSALHFNEGAWQALRKFGAKAAPPLADLFRRRPNVYVIDLLVETKSEGLVELLTPFTDHADIFLRDKVLQALAQSGDPGSIDLLLNQLEDGDLFHQVRAVRTIGQLGLSAAAPKLLDLLKDHELYGPQAALYRAITEAFQEFSGIKKTLANAYPLSSNLSFNIGGANTGLAEMIAQLGNENFQKMNQMLSDAEGRAEEIGEKFNLPPEVVKAFADQTWKFGAMFADARDAKGDHIKVLVDILQAGMPFMRAASALSLPWYMDPSALAPLEEGQQDPDEMVQQAVAWAYGALKMALENPKQDNDEG
jgi:HEAT repeat protein